LGVEGSYQDVVQGFSKTNLAQQAFGVVFGKDFGNIFVAVCLFFFAFSTILGWNFFGKINAEYLFGKKGVFYKVCGNNVDGIDGLIDYDISYKEYVNYGILNPENPSGVCNEIQEKLGFPCMIVDACDISVEVLGKSEGLKLSNETLAEIVRDNPAGQDDECTPIILVRPVKEAE
jgi:hypothetical protein